MSTEDQARRGSSWEATMRGLAADAVVAEAVLYASGGRRLTVEHGQPLTEQAAALIQQLVVDVEQAVDGAGYLGGGTVIERPTSITWTFPSTDVPARQLVLAARLAVDRVNPGGWIVNGDAYACGRCGPGLEATRVSRLCRAVAPVAPGTSGASPTTTSRPLRRAGAPLLLRRRGRRGRSPARDAGPWVPLTGSPVRARHRAQ